MLTAAEAVRWVVKALRTTQEDLLIWSENLTESSVRSKVKDWECRFAGLWLCKADLLQFLQAAEEIHRAKHILQGWLVAKFGKVSVHVLCIHQTARTACRKKIVSVSHEVSCRQLTEFLNMQCDIHMSICNIHLHVSTDYRQQTVKH